MPPSSVEHEPDPVVSEETRVLLEIVFLAALNGPISFLGSALNVMNIIIFVKQGFSDSMNISLCALAVSDMGSLLPLLWISICYNPLFQYSDIGFDSDNVHYMTGGLPHACFVRNIGLITAFITLEKCVCIALPLKVKNIITPKRTLISIVIMFLMVSATYVPILSSIYLESSFNAKRNKTLLGLSYTSTTVNLEKVSFPINVTTQFCSFLIVMVCTIILVLKLFYKSQWRHKAISGVPDSMSNRDKRVMKMVAFISSIFIVCYFPNTLNVIVIINFSPDYSNAGKYHNSYLVSWAIINFIEVTNSSVNILVYYNMSSKFRKTFKELFFTGSQHSVNI